MFIQFSETLYAYNLIVELDQKGKLNEYYNAEQGSNTFRNQKSTFCKVG